LGIKKKRGGEKTASASDTEENRNIVGGTAYKAGQTLGNETLSKQRTVSLLVPLRNTRERMKSRKDAVL